MDSNFRKTLLDAAKAALAQSAISRYEFARIWMVLTFPTARHRQLVSSLEEEATSILTESGAIPVAATAVDWEQFFKQLIEILPALISLLLLLL